ncbi:MAG: 23S rRNA (adenine(2503)-C(2))-methyltransferase RlmN [Kiritimatiellia bacterium]
MIAGAYAIHPEEWGAICQALGAPRYRGSQIACALYRDQIQDWTQATTLPTALRTRLEQDYPIQTLHQIACDEAGDGVKKFAHRCLDGEILESVYIPQNGRLTLCISTEIGCNFKCAFCASGQLGCKRRLRADEIVGQVLAACRHMRQTGLQTKDITRPNNIVVMGMGEPFDNYDETLKALKILNAPQGLYIGARHITISTCGVVPGIDRLADEGVQFELSVSLHAPNDTLRSQIMPVNRTWPLRDLMDACHRYTQKTGRIVTFEYTLVDGLNASPSHARELVRLLRESGGRVNLIPLSPVKEFNGTAPDEPACRAFQEILTTSGINTTLRRSRGKSASAACGQLRRRLMEQPQ